MDELKSLAGGLDALYLTPSAPHQMALFTGDDAARKLPGGAAAGGARCVLRHAPADASASPRKEAVLPAATSASTRARSAPAARTKPS